MKRDSIKQIERKVATASMSQAGLIWYRFKKNKLAVFGLALMTVIILICFTSVLFLDYQKVIGQNTLEQFQKPNAQHWFGTDMYGRDLFARILYGGTISLSTGLIVMAIALVLGVIFGSVAGYFGGITDTLVMRFIDIFMSVPFMLMAMTLILVFGQNRLSLIFALAISTFPGLSRIVRSSIMAIRGMEYVDAARCYGAPVWKILLKHILPNGIGPVIISTTLSLGSTILAIAGLGFLGIGIAPPTPEWGTILSEVRDHIRYYPYLGIIPGAAIGISVLCINFIGDGIRDALDPRTKK